MQDGKATRYRLLGIGFCYGGHEQLPHAQCRSLGAAEPLILTRKQDAPALESDADRDAKAVRIARGVFDKWRPDGRMA